MKGITMIDSFRLLEAQVMETLPAYRSSIFSQGVVCHLKLSSRYVRERARTVLITLNSRTGPEPHFVQVYDSQCASGPRGTESDGTGCIPPKCPIAPVSGGHQALLSVKPVSFRLHKNLALAIQQAAQNYHYVLPILPSSVTLPIRSTTTVTLHILPIFDKIEPPLSPAA